MTARFDSSVQCMLKCTHCGDSSGDCVLATVRCEYEDAGGRRARERYSETLHRNSKKTTTPRHRTAAAAGEWRPGASDIRQHCMSQDESFVHSGHWFHSARLNNLNTLNCTARRSLSPYLVQLSLLAPCIDVPGAVFVATLAVP